MKKIRVGIFGTGFGALVTAPAIKEIKYYDLIGIYGRNKLKLKKIKKKYKINTYENIDELLDIIDLAIISLPPFLHYKLALNAIKKNKHILCEKPFTLNKIQAKKIYLLSKRRRSKIFAVNFQMRFQPLRVELKKIIKKKIIGEILSFRCSYDFSSRLYVKNKHNWWSKKNLGGGVVNAMGSHQIDLLTWLFGKITKINAIQKGIFKKSKSSVEDIAICTIKFKSNIIGSLSLSSVAVGWKTSTMDIYGTKGAIFLNGERDLYIAKKTSRDKQEKPNYKKIKFKETLLKKKWIEQSIWRSAHYRLLENLAKSIKYGHKYKGANFDDGYTVRSLLDQII
jgi:hypothetical protein